MELYFAYGSNLDVGRVKRRCHGAGDIRKVSIGYLPDHRLAFTQYYPGWEGGVADVIRSPKSRVWGVLYELTKEALEILDGYEGYPTDYTRTRRTIITPEGGRYRAWVYSVLRKDGDFIPPSHRYLTIIKRTAKESGFPQEYISYLESIKTASV